MHFFPPKWLIYPLIDRLTTMILIYLSDLWRNRSILSWTAAISSDFIVWLTHFGTGLYSEIKAWQIKVNWEKSVDKFTWKLLQHHKLCFQIYSMSLFRRAVHRSGTLCSKIISCCLVKTVIFWIKCLCQNSSGLWIKTKTQKNKEMFFNWVFLSNKPR